MKLFQNISNAFKALTGQAELAQYHQEFDRVLGIRGVVPDAKLTDSQAMAKYTTGAAAWVSIAVNRKMADCTMPLYFADAKGNKIEKVDKKILEPINRGFAGIETNELIGRIIGHEDLTGNAIWWKTYWSDYGKIQHQKGNKICEQFIPFTPGKFKINKDSKGLAILSYTLYFDDGTQKEVLPDEIIHFKRNCMISPFIGIGLVSQARYSIESEEVSSVYQKDFFANDGKPDITILDKTNRSYEDAKRFGKMYKNAYEERKYKKSILYLAGEGIDAKALNVTNSDMQFLENRGYDKQTIISMMESCAAVLGESDVYKASASHMINNYYKTANLRIQHVIDIINKEFVHKIDPNTNLMSEKHATGDTDTIDKQVKGGLLEPWRGSKALGLPYNENDPAQNTRYISKAYVPMNMVAEGATIQPAGFGGGSSPEKSQKKNLNNGYIVGKSWQDIDKKELYSFKENDRNVIGALSFQMKWIEKGTKSKEKTFNKYNKSIARFFYDQIDRVTSNLKEKFGEKAIKQQIDPDSVNIIFDITSENELLTNELRSIHTSAIQKSIDDINDLTLTDQAVISSFSNPAVITQVNNLANRVKRINDSTKEAIRKVIKEGVDEGLTVVEIADNINKLPIQWEKNTVRHMTIARTETNLAYREGAKIAFTELGVKEFDVVGCAGTRVDADYGDMTETVGACGLLNQPMSVFGKLDHHPNHIGMEVPSVEI